MRPPTAGMTNALNMVASLVGLARDTLKRSHLQFRCACLPSSRTQSALDASCGRLAQSALFRKLLGFCPQVQLAEPGDKIDDPSIAWPDSRKTVELGVVEIDKVDPDSDAAQRALLFLEDRRPHDRHPQSGLRRL